MMGRMVVAGLLVLAILGVANALIVPRGLVRRSLHLSATGGATDPRFQALVDRIKSDPSFDICANPEDREVLMANVDDKLRAVDNSIKRLAGAALHPTKGVASTPDLKENLSKIADPIKKTLSSPKSEFFRSPHESDTSGLAEIRKEFVEQLKKEGKAVPSFLEN